MLSPLVDTIVALQPMKVNGKKKNINNTEGLSRDIGKVIPFLVGFWERGDALRPERLRF